MWGGSRRPNGPFQVNCVLVAAVLAVAFSISPIRAPQGQQWREGGPPIRPNSGSLDARILDATYRTITDDASAVLADGDRLHVAPVAAGAGANNIDPGSAQSILPATSGSRS
jgi:hypothetical protein